MLPVKVMYARRPFINPDAVSEFSDAFASGGDSPLGVVRSKASVFFSFPDVKGSFFLARAGVIEKV